jgi:hypothetical protein
MAIEIAATYLKSGTERDKFLRRDDGPYIVARMKMESTREEVV